MCHEKNKTALEELSQAFSLHFPKYWACLVMGSFNLHFTFMASSFIYCTFCNRNQYYNHILDLVLHRVMLQIHGPYTCAM